MNREESAIKSQKKARKKKLFENKLLSFSVVQRGGRKRDKLWSRPPISMGGLDGKTFQIDIFKGKLFYQPQLQLQLQLAKTLPLLRRSRS